MNAMCKVIIIKVLQRIFGLWFHEITHICNIYLLNPASLANQEMLISTMILVWNGSKNYSNWGVIIFHPIWAFFPIRICRKTLILGPRWFAKSSGYVPFISHWSKKINHNKCILTTFKDMLSSSPRCQDVIRPCVHPGYYSKYQILRDKY